jgi:hypothetical protein
MIQSEYLSDLRHKAREIRNDAQKSFYFLEAEDLRRRPAPGQWSIIEVFAHINLVQGFYLANIANALEQAPENTGDNTQLTWLGQKFIKGMAPQEGIIKWKVKTFKKIDPVYRAKRGVAINENIVFRDFINDIEEMEELIIKAYDKDLTALKVPTFFPILKINLADAMGFSLAHTERHVLQARNILGED